MNKKRLLKAAAYLESIPKKHWDHFYMGSWHNGVNGYKTAEDLMHCGTTACALGWLCAVPEFKEAGLQLKPGLVHWDENRVVPSYKQYSEEFAGMRFFGLTKSQVIELFMTHWDFTPLDVASRMRKMVEEA